MAFKSDSKPARLVRILEATVLVIATLYFGRPILIPIVAAVLLTFLLSPPVNWLERRHVPRVPAVILIVVLLFSIFGLIAWNATTQLSELIVELPKYQQNLHTKIQDLRGSDSGTLRRIGESIGQLSTEIKESANDSSAALDDARKKVAEPPQPTPVKLVADPTSPLQTIQLAVTSLAGPLASFGVLTVLVIFMLLVREDLRDRLLRLAGTSRITLTTRTIDELGTRISRYLLQNALVNTGFGFVIGLGLFAIGVQYAALWGLLAGLLRFIPYLGVLIAAAAPIGLSIAQFSSWTQPLIAISLFVIAELLTDNVIEPYVYGRSVGVSPVALLLAAMFWGWIWGPVGLVLSVPLTVSLAVLGKYLPPLEPLWILLGNDASLSPSVRYYQRLLADDEDEAGEVVDEYSKDHTLVETFDDVLLPALAHAERDSQHDELSETHQDSIWQTTEQFVQDLSPEQSEDKSAKATDVVGAILTVVCVPIQERADDVAIKMLSRVVPENIRIEATATTMLTGELLSHLETSQPDALCISALAPGGVGQVRYVCKRVHHQFPTLPILVGRWAFHGNIEKMIVNAKQRGASEVAVDLKSAVAALNKISPRLRPQTADTI